jgi:hypothetical protein
VIGAYHSGRDDLIDNVLREAIPMHGRMIHGRDRGDLWEDIGGLLQLIEEGIVESASVDGINSLIVEVSYVMQAPNPRRDAHAR